MLGQFPNSNVGDLRFNVHSTVFLFTFGCR